MSTGQMCKTPCETCQKEGLPLLLTRYALHAADTGAPKLSGQLNDAALKAIPLGKNAHYGLRLLRSGYVYVHDEARKHWDEYFVTADGFLTKLPPRPKQGTRSAPKTEFACARNGLAPLAGVITIRNPKHATNVWIGFSDVEWTDAIFDKHQDAAYRARHMRKIAVSGGKVAPQPHTAPLDKVDAHVPEFKLDAAIVNKHITPWAPFQFNSRVANAKDFKAAVQKARPQGGAAIVAVDDPAGLTIEIANLMESRKLTYMNHEGVATPRFAASSIASVEATIKEQAKLAEIFGGEMMAEQAEAGPSAVNPSNPATWGMPGDPELAQRWRTHTPQSLQKAAGDAWKKYTHDRAGKPRFDHAASQAWLKSYNESFRKFDTENIAPLAKAHVAWLQHNCMVSHMSCNYDCQNLESGAAYTAVVAAMCRHTADKQPSYDLYLKWLKEGETSTANNLLMRALGFNQDKLLEEIKKADAAPVDGRAFPTDMVVDFFKDGLQKLPQGGHAAMADLLQNVGGALFKNMDEMLKGGPAARALAAVAAVAGVQFTTVTASGNRGKFVQHVMRAVMQLDPNMKVSHNDMAKAVAAQMRLMEIEGLPMNKSDKRRWLMVLDTDATRKTAGSSSKTGAALAAELAKSGLRRVEDLPRLKAEAFKAGAAGKAFDAGGNVVIGLVQCYNIVKLVSDYQNQMKHEGHEPLARLATAGFAVLGSFGEATGLALQRMQEAGRLRNAAGLKALRVADVLKVGGKLLGLVTGLVVAGMDYLKSREASAAGDTGLSNAYFASFALGGSLAVAFFFSHLLGPIGWLIVGVAVIALLVLTLWIEKNKDNKIHEWLARCHFGSNPDKYKTEQEHAEQLKRAFA